MTPANSVLPKLFGSGNASGPVFVHLQAPQNEWEYRARAFAERP
jgi:hypothetical protein